MRLARLTDAVGRQLDWSKERPQRREFQLHDSRSLVAVLTWVGAGSRARGSTSEGHWTLNRGADRHAAGAKGAIQPWIVVQSESGGNAYEVGLGSEEALTFGGDNYQWQLDANARVAKWLSAGGETLVTMSYSPLATDAEVVIDPAAGGLADLSLLILTGWYALRNGRG